jgi:hypothetical protein
VLSPCTVRFRSGTRRAEMLAEMRQNALPDAESREYVVPYGPLLVNLDYEYWYDAILAAYKFQQFKTHSISR